MNTKKQKMSKELKTGIVVILIIFIGVWGINFLKDTSLFEGSKRNFFVEYNDVQGLNEVSIVTINGKSVGKVINIGFHPEKKDKMLVEFILDDDIKFSKSSIAKMYSASLVTGVQNIAIIPKYDGDVAEAGDYLVGDKDNGMLDVVKKEFGPVKNQISSVLIGTDSLISGVNNIMDEKAQKSINKSVIAFETTINNMNSTLASVNSLLANNKANISTVVSNSKKITDDFSIVSKKLSEADLTKLINEFESSLKNMNTTLTNVNAMIADVKKGNGTLGKLMTDDKMYVNLTNSAKEMEELLREMKLNPKRFVHFSLFGKKPKVYNQEKNRKNVSNK